jgi:hypothetical protein
MRVVKEDIRIENEIFREARGGVRALVEFGKEKALFLVRLKNGRSKHSEWIQGLNKRSPAEDRTVEGKKTACRSKQGRT